MHIQTSENATGSTSYVGRVFIFFVGGGLFVVTIFWVAFTLWFEQPDVRQESGDRVILFTIGWVALALVAAVISNLLAVIYLVCHKAFAAGGEIGLAIAVVFACLGTAGLVWTLTAGPQVPVAHEMRFAVVSVGFPVVTWFLLASRLLRPSHRRRLSMSLTRGV